MKSLSGHGNIFSITNTTSHFYQDLILIENSFFVKVFLQYVQHILDYTFCERK